MLFKRVLKIGGIVLLVALVFVGGGILSLMWARSLAQDANEALGRIVSSEGVDEAEYVELGGVKQWIKIRGQDRRNPVLLFIHGGPGNATSDLAYSFQRPWVDYLTVVQWDQRAAGRSDVDAEALVGTLSKDQIVADAIELIEHLRRRFEQPKVILVGHSWGTIIGSSVAARRPDLLYAYAGIAQVVSWEGGFLTMQRELTEMAESKGDAALAQAMREAGSPPRSGDPKEYLDWVAKVQGPAAEQGGAWRNVRREDMIPIGLVLPLSSPSLSWSQLLSSFRPASPELLYFPLVKTVLDWDFREHVGLRIDVPVVFIAGRHDMGSPLSMLETLEQELCAPSKSLVVLEHSAHMPMFEQPGRLLGTLITQVLPFAQGEQTQLPVEPAEAQEGACVERQRAAGQESASEGQR